MSAAKRARRAFTAEEDDAIWQYVNVENTKDHTASLRMWERLATRIQGRSADTLRGRYLNTLMPAMAKHLATRDPPVVWEGNRVVNMAATAPAAKRSKRDASAGSEDDMAALAALADEEPDQAEAARLSRGAVRRLMRNLPLAEEPRLACVAVTGEGRATLWDGTAAVETEVSGAATLEPGAVYAVTRFANNRREGRRVIRILAAVKQQQTIDVATARIAMYRKDEGDNQVAVREQPPILAEREQEQQQQGEGREAAVAARLVAEELAAATGVSAKVALHALFVCSGSAGDAHEYLTAAAGERQAWSPDEDAVLVEKAADPLQLKLEPQLAARSWHELQRRKDFLGQQ